MDVRLKAIIPVRVWNDRTVMSAVTRTMNTVGARARKALEEATANWDPPVSFFWVGDPEMGVLEIATSDIRFKWVDEGVPRHIIRPRRRGKPMIFPQFYQAKSTPGRVIRGSGAYSGDLQYVYQPVNHPGIKARRITKRIQEITQPQMTREVRQAIANAVGQ